MQDDPQRATLIGQKELKGGSTYPAPETDAANGVTGTVQVTEHHATVTRVANRGSGGTMPPRQNVSGHQASGTLGA